MNSKVSNVQKVMEKLELVQDLTGNPVMKITGTNLRFATPEDEFSRFFISEIKNMFMVIKKAGHFQGLTMEEMLAISDDIKTYSEYLESAGEAYLLESKLKELLED